MLRQNYYYLLMLRTTSAFCYLDVFGECIKNLLGHIYCLREIPLALFINNIFARIIPVEITDGLLDESEEWGQKGETEKQQVRDTVNDYY